MVDAFGFRFLLVCQSNKNKRSGESESCFFCSPSVFGALCTTVCGRAKSVAFSGVVYYIALQNLVIMLCVSCTTVLLLLLLCSFVSFTQ